MRDYTRFVHKFEHNDKTLFAVGQWSQDRAQYTVPHDHTTYLLTGCSASFAKKPAGLPDRYSSRQAALRRARYLFADQVQRQEYLAKFEEDPTT